MLIPIKLELGDRFRGLADRLAEAEETRDPPAPPHEAMPDTANSIPTITFNRTFNLTVLLLNIATSFPIVLGWKLIQLSPEQTGTLSERVCPSKPA
jgi:hypothetical protein